jgi:sugar phosphate isomerase/epimerase
MMRKGMERRRFLKTVGVAALTGMAFDVFGSPRTEAGSGDGNSAESKMPRLFAGCCAQSYRQELLHGQITLEDFIQKAVELRLDAVDLTTYYLKSTDPEYLNNLRHLAYKNAIVFSGAACGVTMVKADVAERANSLLQIKKWVDVTDRLGASHLRIFAGKPPSGASLQQAVDWVVETMKAACDYSGQRGITLGMEDHVGVSESADTCLEVMHRVNSPYAGINLDVTHFIPTPTKDAYAQIAACIPYATNTHIRDHFDDQTPIDMDRLWRLFAQAGFKGYMSAEYEHGFEPAMIGVPKLVAEIRALCQKYSRV